MGRTRIEDDCLHDFWRNRKRQPPGCGGYQQHFKRHKGETMKKHCVRILSAFFGLAALAITAKGQTADQLIVNIPYEFVVAGKTLPAGSYRINRVYDDNDRALVISNVESRAAVLVLPTEVAGKTRNEQPGVGFEQVGDQHLLSKIETAGHVFKISVPSPAVLEAAMKKHSGSSASMSSGNN
jgi:hypothetical protein